MHYYRYRPSGELSIKEFMYDEIYFASALECNDPFDGKTFAIFEADTDKWRRLLELAWKMFSFSEKSKWEEQLAVYLSKMSPMSYDTALKLDYVKALRTIISPPNLRIAYVLSKEIRNFLNLYKPKDTYFVSFSRVCNDPLMWSHYGSMHRGHCLIFKAIDGCLYQCPRRKRKFIRRKTIAGIAPSMSYSIPDSFPFQDVTYRSDVTPNDAFSYFPQHVFGCKLEEQDRLELISRQTQQYLVKHNSWSYEQESRLIISTPPAWLFGECIGYSQQERLFYYQPNQLVGIILGARMDVQQKMRFRELIQARMERIACDPGDNAAVFDFVLFQAILPDDRREIIIEPEEIFTLTRAISKTDDDFEKYLRRWQEGWAIEFKGSSASRRKFE